MKLRVVVMIRSTQLNADRDKSYVIHHLRKHKSVLHLIVIDSSRKSVPAEGLALIVNLAELKLTSNFRNEDNLNRPRHQFDLI